MREFRTSGSVGAAGKQLPAATRRFIFDSAQSQHGAPVTGDAERSVPIGAPVHVEYSPLNAPISPSPITPPGFHEGWPAEWAICY